MVKKIAAIIIKDNLEPKGGPSGYLYTLKKTNYPNKSFEIFFENYNFSKVNRNFKFKDNFFKIFSIFLEKDFLYEFQNLIRYKKFFNSFIKYLDKYKILHFHRTKDLYFFCKLFPDFCRKKHLIIMSHSPLPSYEETFDVIYNETNNKKLAEKFSFYQKKFDIFAFNYADTILFPTQGSVDTYLKFLKKYVKNYKHKLHFLPTGVYPFSPKIKNLCFRKKYGIPSNALVFAFIGRRNYIKGFDIFKSVAEKLSLKYRDLYFLVAGKGISINQRENIIDLGWTNDPDSLANASDFIVVPNRETYFDLIILQSMSINKPIITTFTGGNKYFYKKNIDVFFMKNISTTSLEEIIIRIYRNEIKPKFNNKEFYNQNFSPEKFIERYNQFYKNIWSEIYD